MMTKWIGKYLIISRTHYVILLQLFDNKNKSTSVFFP